MKKLFGSYLGALLFLLPTLHCAHAEEGGTGHYVSGSQASFVDGVLPNPGHFARTNLFHYNGTLVIPGSAAAGFDRGVFDARYDAIGTTVAWRPNIDMGKKWIYQMSGSLAYVRTEVDANYTLPGNVQARASDVLYGLNDLQLVPIMLNYQATPDLQVMFSSSVYVPVGDYKSSRLANIGKNYWSIEPMLSALYFGKQNLWEFSLFTGVTFNTENKKTDYKSGSQFHTEFTVAKHFPLHKGLGGIGITGYWYKQLEKDSGAGAVFGDFEAYYTGIGPTISYTGEFYKQNVAVELKWLHQTDANFWQNGDTILMKAGLAF